MCFMHVNVYVCALACKVNLLTNVGASRSISGSNVVIYIKVKLVCKECIGVVYQLRI